MGRERLLDAVDEVMDFTELAGLQNQMIDKLSKGQTQRLCLARTLISDAQFLILDEPAAGLDPKARLEFKNLVHLLKARGKTLLISSHILSELGEMCDALIFMNAGTVIHDGNMEDLLHRQTESGYAFEIRTAGDNTASLEEWLALRRGWNVRHVQQQKVVAAFVSCEPEAVAAELRQLCLDLPVIDFHRSERRLEEAFVDILIHPRQRGTGPAAESRLFPGKPIHPRLMNTSRSLDFPIWMPSALVKELRQGLRTPSFILLVSIVPSLLSFFFLFSFIINPLDGEPFVSPDGCQIIFWVTMVVALLFIMPLRASTSIRNELLTRNNELLLLTRQSAGRIVLGKWISFMAQSLLIAFISLPFFLIRYYYGEINLVQDVTLFFLLYLGSGMLTAYTLWASATPSWSSHPCFCWQGNGSPPAAQNTAAPLRKLLLAFFRSLHPPPLPFLENASGSIQNIMTGNSIFVMV